MRDFLKAYGYVLNEINILGQLVVILRCEEEELGEDAGDGCGLN